MKYTAHDIRARLRLYYPVLEWALLFEVANGTGGAKSRSADAIAMNLWPSRGLAIHGIEIKVGRGDWLKELAQPAKAEAIGQFCDYWWIAAPAEIINESEVPEAWGLLIPHGDTMRVRKQAQKQEAVAPTRQFIAALARQLGNADAEDIASRARLLMESEIKRLTANLEGKEKQAQHELEQLKSQVAAFEKASGLEMTPWTDGKDLGEKVKIASAIHATGWNSVAGLCQQMKQSAATLETMLQAIGATVEQEKEAAHEA